MGRINTLKSVEAGAAGPWAGGRRRLNNGRRRQIRRIRPPRRGDELRQKRLQRKPKFQGHYLSVEAKQSQAAQLPRCHVNRQRGTRAPNADQVGQERSPRERTRLSTLAT